ncbi:unnamed protein product [Closterium sp. NIES-54]
MGSQHNPDELMGEEEFDASFSIESFFTEEAVTPAVSAPPLAKHVCAAGSSSFMPVAPPMAPVVPPVTPANPIVALAITGRYQRLRRNRDSVGVVVADLVRDTDVVVNLLFPEALEAHQSRIITCVRSILRGRDFAGGRVPVFEASVGDLMRLPRKLYGRHVLHLPTMDDANRFKRLLLITYRSSEGPTADIKVFQDPAPEFSAAKSHGETVLVLRNVQVGLAVRTLRALLLSSSSNGVKWLDDLLHFHKLFDPYEESFLPQMLGIVVASPNDPRFEAIPAVIRVPEVQELILVTISVHSCTVCTSNHRTRDHNSFAAVRRNRITNPFLITMGQLQNINGISLLVNYVLLSSSIVPPVLPAHVYIVAACRAMEHIANPSHVSAIQHISGNTTLVEEYGDVKAHVFNQNGSIATFLAQG